MPDDLAEQLALLSSAFLARLYHALDDLVDAPLHAEILNLIWSRHATAGGDWPRRQAEIGDPNARLPEPGVRRLHWLVGYCGAGPSPKGRDDDDHRGVSHDAGHLVVRRLYFVVGDWTFGGTECTCGRRSDHEITHPQHLRVKWRQATPDVRVWPTRMIEVPGAGRLIPHFQVCQYAKTADDPDHAPNATGMQCLCGRYLGDHGNEPTDRLLPAF